MKRIVVKLGTSTVTGGGKKLSPLHMGELARQASLLHHRGLDIILVSSGAIAAGREILSDPHPENKYVPFKQMLASVGQVHLMKVWEGLFAEQNVRVGQVLLTRSDFNARSQYLNARNTFKALLDQRVLPICNENDTTATSEIKVGDNDRLSAFIANLVGADLLILLTDQEGLFTADPRQHPDAKLIPLIEKIDEKTQSHAKDSSNPLKLGTGGMVTKVEAARLASSSGIKTIIAKATAPNILLELAESKGKGTLFMPQNTLLESRKRWLLAEKREGKIHIDAGAEKKLIKEGASLLAIGICNIEAKFDRGAVVEIRSAENHPLGVGIANYSSTAIEKLKGKHSKLIEEILSYSYGHEIVHRDNLTLFN